MWKFGRDFTQAAVDNTFGTVNARVVSKLRIEAPSLDLVDSYLSAIAKAYNVEWEAPERAELEPPMVPLAVDAALRMNAPLPPTPSVSDAAVENKTTLQGKPHGALATGMEGREVSADDDAPPVFVSNPNVSHAAAPDSKDGSIQASVQQGPSKQRAPSTATQLSVASTSSSTPDFDALSARFEALKKRGL
jgi:hypothetical protein